MTSVVRRREHEDSGEYSDASQVIEQNNSENEGVAQESDYDSQGSNSEHSEGEGETQETERRVDDDEDRSNPQYIPKKGTFYEHDDRTAASGEETNNTTTETSTDKKEGSETPSERRRPPRKSEVTNKWSHDKFNENEQMPKSRDELVAIYGYDIRNEDAPPHARRNRRYGRGPNKYTRTWEDEEAYRRQAAAQPVNKKPPNLEEFPELDNKRNSRKPRAPRPRSKSQPSHDSNKSDEKIDRRIEKREVKEEKMPPLENLTITTSVFNNSQSQPQRKVSATVAQQRPVPTEQARKKPQQLTTTQQQQQAPVTQQQQAKTVPSQQQQVSGVKRYSSLRQRPLAETYSPQQQQQQQPTTTPQQQQQQTTPIQHPVQQQPPHRYHGGEYPPPPAPAPSHQPNPAPLPHPQQIIHQQQVRSAANQSQAPPHPPQQVRLGMMESQQIVAQHQHHSMHNLPPQHNMAQMPPQGQGYAPPAMMPAQYMQPAAGPPPPAAGFGVYPPPAYPHQPIYPHHNYATQAGGVTYYPVRGAEETRGPERAPRRATAAIPIVTPNTNRPANSSENDNIDRIVENMFVRKPWPATHGDAKEKTDNRSSQEPQETSQPNSLTSSSISSDSKPSESIDKPEPKDHKQEKQEEPTNEVEPETITTDA